MKRFSLRCLVIAATLLMSISVFADATSCTTVSGNLVANCGFETGDLSGWTAGGNWNTGYNLVIGDYNNTGNGSLMIGNYNWQGIPIISQTIGDTPGQTYVFSFSLAQYTFISRGVTYFQAFWNGGEVLNITGRPEFDYTTYSFSVTGTGSDRISFQAIDDVGDYFVDDVAVVASNPVVSGVSAPVPEPFTLSLVGSGLLGILIRRRSARK